MTVLPDDFTLAKFVRLSPTTGGVVLVEQDEEQSKGVRLTTVMNKITMTEPVHPLNSIMSNQTASVKNENFCASPTESKNPKKGESSRDLFRSAMFGNDRWTFASFGVGGGRLCAGSWSHDFGG